MCLIGKISFQKFTFEILIYYHKNAQNLIFQFKYFIKLCIISEKKDRF